MGSPKKNVSSVDPALREEVDAHLKQVFQASLATNMLGEALEALKMRLALNGIEL